MDLVDKMNETHKNMLRTMLGLNELPIFLLERYFSIKKLLDKIDGFISASDLIRIALDCGFNPDTMRFLDVPPIKYMTDGDAKILGLDKEDSEAEAFTTDSAETVIEDVETENDMGIETVAPAGDVEEEPDPAADPENAEVVTKEETAVEGQLVEGIPKGKAVTVLEDGRFISGTIEGPTEIDGSPGYDVKTDKGTIEALEENVQVD